MSTENSAAPEAAAENRKSKGDINITRLLRFTMGDEEYGVELKSVREAIDLPKITKLPKTPDYYLGIVNLRGEVISIIDLRIKLGIADYKVNQDNVVIVFSLNQKESVGVVVDSVSNVVAIPTHEVVAPPSLNSNVDASYITGVTNQEDKMVIIMDIAKVLDADDIESIHRQVQEQIKSQSA